MIWASEEFWEKFKQHPTLWKTHWFIFPFKRKWRWLKQNNKTTLSFKQYLDCIRQIYE